MKLGNFSISLAVKDIEASRLHDIHGGRLAELATPMETRSWSISMCEAVDAHH